MAEKPLEPLAVSAPAQEPATASSTPPIGGKPPIEQRDPVSEFLKDDAKADRRRERRAQKETPAADALATVETPATEPVSEPVVEPTASLAETPSGETPEPAKPSGEAKPAVAPVAAEVPEKAPAGEKPAVEQSAIRSYADDEKIALGANPDGSPLEWTRKQIVDRLRKAIADESGAAQAEKYRSVFNASAEECERDWVPLLTSLREAPYKVPFIQAILDTGSPEKVKYLQECAAHFDQVVQPEPSAAAAPNGAVPPEVQKRLDHVEAQLSRQTAEARRTRANNEWSEVTRKYPFLLQDEKLGRSLWKLADLRAQEQSSAGVPEHDIHALLDVVAEQAALLDARLIAYRAQNAPPSENAPAPEKPPALLGGGTQPSATRQSTASAKPKIYTDLQDAVAEAARADLTR